MNRIAMMIGAAAILPLTAHAQCVPLAVMSARIAAGSPIGGTVCGAGTGLPAAVPRGTGLPAAVPRGTFAPAIDPAAAGAAAVGAAGIIGGVLDALTAPSPAEERAKAESDALNRDIARDQALSQLFDAISGPAISLRDAICAPDQQSAKCAQAINQITPLTTSLFYAYTASNEPAMRAIQAEITATANRLTSLNSADIPNSIDFTTHTTTWNDGTTYQDLTGPANQEALQRLCRAGQTNACPGGAVHFNPPAPAATSAAPPGEYDYKAAMRQYEQAQQLYQSKLQGGPGRNP